MIYEHEQFLTECYFFSLKVQLVKAKMNLYLLPVYSLISTWNIKYVNIINNYCVPHTYINTREWQWTTFQLAVKQLNKQLKIIKR